MRKNVTGSTIRLANQSQDFQESWMKNNGYMVIFFLKLKLDVSKRNECSSLGQI